MIRRLALLAFVLVACCSGGDWAVAPPAREGLDPGTLDRLDSDIRLRLPHVRSLLIARHGRLVIEKYYGGATADQLQNIQSMTKSITSAMVGIALKKRLIRSIDDKVLDYLPEYRTSATDSRVQHVTIRHLLTMSSGLDELPLSFDKAVQNPVAEIIKARLIFDPDRGFKYSSAGAHVLGAVLRSATGTGVADYARAELFAPLGMGPFEWYADKTGLQSGGMSGLFRARDILKLGELYLRSGQWNGAELIPPAFVADSVKIHNTGDFYGEKARYGYMWWIAMIGGRGAFYARGYGGQYLMVVPSLDLVVLCTSDWQKPEYPEHFALLETYVLPAAVSN